MKKNYFLLAFIFFLVSFAKPAKAQCTAAFTYTVTGDTAYFTDASTTSFGTIVSWTWSFGDGNFSNIQNPTNEYTACGIYNVSLTIFTSTFCSNTFNTTVTVSGGITPSFTYNVDTTSGNVTFQPQPLGTNLNYIWDYGDGTYDSTFAGNHTYPTGTYYVCLTVYDDDSLCTSTICDSVVVYVSPSSCATTFTFNDNGGGNVTFNTSTYDPGNTYTWDYGETSGGSGGAFGFYFHTYPAAGTYYVCLTTVDSATMCTSVFCDSVVLVVDITACDFTFSYFDNDGTVGFTANPLTSSNYSWDFGDGNSGAGAATSHTYATGGMYFVCASITDGFNGCTNTYCDSILVSITGISEQNSEDLFLSVYPNPTTDQMTIAYQLTQSGSVAIELYDLVGKRIYSSSAMENAGKHQAVISLAQLNQGAYFIKINSETGNSGKLIIKN